MRWGGVTILLFLVWHLLNFTIGKVNVAGGSTDDPYDLLVDSFQVWWLTLIYLRGHGRARPCTCGTACGAPRRPSA